MTGVLDTKKYTDERNRAWIFRTCGYGHGAEWWSEFISTLRMFGYDYVLSVEHEDSLMSPEEGLSKAVRFLDSIVIKDRRHSCLVGLKLEGCCFISGDFAGGVEGADVPRPAPEFAVRMMDGKDMLLSQQRGKVVCLLFILTTCPHCQKLVGTMSKLQPELAPQRASDHRSRNAGHAVTLRARLHSRFQTCLPGRVRGPKTGHGVHAARSEVYFLQSLRYVD